MANYLKTFGAVAIVVGLTSACAGNPVQYVDPTEPTEADIKAALITPYTNKIRTCEDLPGHYSFLAEQASQAFNHVYDPQSYLRNISAAKEQSNEATKAVKALIIAADRMGCSIDGVHFRYR